MTAEELREILYKVDDDADVRIAMSESCDFINDTSEIGNIYNVESYINHEETLVLVPA